MSGRLIAIGDIHGCIHALDAVLDEIQPNQHDQLVVLGDVIDQGWESSLVVERLIGLDDECTLVRLKGNHEEMFLSAYASEGLRRYWELAGGVATLNSYRFGADLLDIPELHRQFLGEALDYHETEQHIFVHANYQFDLPMDEQTPDMMHWALMEPEMARPHQSGKTVVVGHTEQANGEVLDLGFAKCIDTACWRCGWLTAMEVNSGQIWQASRFGQLRQPGTDAVGPTSSLRR